MFAATDTCHTAAAVAVDFIVTKRKKLTAEGNSKNTYMKMCSCFTFFNLFADINVNKYTNIIDWGARKGAEESNK